MDLVTIKHPKLPDGENIATVPATTADVLIRKSGWRAAGKDDKAAVDNVTPPPPAGQ